LLLVTMVIDAVLQFLIAHTQALPAVGLFWTLVSFVVSLALEVFLFAALYRYLPDARLDWRDALTGGAFTAVLWEIGKKLLAIYIGRNNYAAAYGAVGSTMSLLLWVYYGTQVLFLGAELAAVVAERRGAKEPGRPPHDQRVPAPRPAHPVPAETGPAARPHSLADGLIAVVALLATLLRLIPALRKAATHGKPSGR
jgi:membrane protein